MVPPDMADYVDAIHRGFAEMMVHETTELWCEPGRALVAEASSILTKVELRKGDALYLNDGSYGSLFDAAHTNWPFPVKLVRARAAKPSKSEALKPFRFYGPTCDSIDHMPGPFWLPDDVRRRRLHRDRHAGRLWRGHVDPLQRLWRHRDRRWSRTRPMASMFGLAERSIPTARSTEEDARKVVRLSRPKGKAGQEASPQAR